MLEAGTKAPDFELPDQNGEMHKLSDYAGKKVILYFYPKDNTAGCTKQAYLLDDKELKSLNLVLGKMVLKAEQVKNTINYTASGLSECF